MKIILQSILLSAKLYNIKTASAWIKKNNYKLEYRNKKPELIKNYYHFRQADKGGHKRYFIKKKDDILYVYKILKD
jgi:hypothetical protein